jgi:hypothetical protein
MDHTSRFEDRKGKREGTDTSLPGSKTGRGKEKVQIHLFAPLDDE